MKISIVLGTRPEIIKMSPVIRECERLGLDYFILHTGQHYSYNMDRVFFEDLELPEARYNLDVGSGHHGWQTGKMLVGIEKILEKERPDVVLVQGDTNSVLAGALAAVKLGIKVGHVEAGLRSYDRRMPEEVNRTLADHCSDYLFAPTEKSKKILLGEGVSKEKIFVTGNTVVDAVFQNLEIANRKRNVMNDLELRSKDYFLVTAHRQENVDNKARFAWILRGLKYIAEEFGLPLVYPIHPRSRRRMKEFGLQLDEARLIEPVDFLSFLQLENNAKLVLTDSGGVQEETCVLGVPCVTLRDNTERPETVEVGSNVLAGADSDKILKCAKMMVSRENSWENPFGDGDAGRKTVEILRGNDLFGTASAPQISGKAVEAEGSGTRIVIVVPTLNECEAVGKVLDGVKDVMDGYEYRMLVVDGHSIDGTDDIAREKGAEVIYQRGKGYGDALRTGFLYARKRLDAGVIVMMDADFTYDPRDIPELVAPILEHEADLVVGNRFAGMQKGAMSLVNRVGNRMLSLVAKFALRLNVYDTQSGMRAFRSELLDSVSLVTGGMPFALEMLAEARSADARIDETPVSYRPRLGRQSFIP